MWNLNTPWTELFIRASLIYFILFILFRISGKKHLGELAPFDFILLLIISEATQNALIKQEDSIGAAFIVISTLLVWDALLNRISFHFKKS